nr:hypothetical protein [uncultured bacterium]
MRAKRCHQRGHCILVRKIAGRDGSVHRPDDVIGTPSDRQVDEPSATGNRGLHPMGHLDGEAGLADAGRPGDAHQAVPVQRRGQFCRLATATDEAAQDDGQIAGRSRRSATFRFHQYSQRTGSRYRPGSACALE